MENIPPFICARFVHEEVWLGNDYIDNSDKEYNKIACNLSTDTDV